MYIEKLTVRVYSDSQVKGKEKRSDLIGEFTSQDVGSSSDKLEQFLDGIMYLYEFAPVRLVVSFETENI